MELSNNALKIYRESLEFRRTNFEDTTPSTQCLQAYNKLSQCVLNNKINVLDAEGMRNFMQPSVHNAKLMSGKQSVQGLCVVSTQSACSLKYCLGSCTLNNS
jgi:hypothetical protein